MEGFFLIHNDNLFMLKSTRTGNPCYVLIKASESMANKSWD